MSEKYTTDETLKILGVTRQTLWKWRTEGVLNSEMVKNQRYYLNDSKFNELLAKQSLPTSTLDDYEQRISRLETELETAKLDISELKELVKSISSSKSPSSQAEVVRGQAKKQSTKKEVKMVRPKGSKVKKGEVSPEELEQKAQFILKVCAMAMDAFGSNSRCNPMSLRCIDPASKNITTRIKAGKRPPQINNICERILEINAEYQLFSMLVFDDLGKVEIDKEVVARIKAEQNK